MTTINPTFSPLQSAGGVKNHIKNLTQPTPNITHSEVLEQLLEQLEPLDYQALVYPEVTKIRAELKVLAPDDERAKDLRKQLDSKKLQSKHYQVITIEHLLKTATKNHWGLCKKNSFVYVFNGQYWASIEVEQLQTFLGKAAQKMGVPEFSAKYHKFKDELYKQFISEACLPTPNHTQDKVLINLSNGTFEVKGAKQHRRMPKSSDFLTYQLPFEHNTKAQAPLFEKYLNRVLPEKEKQLILAEYLGFLFIPNGSKDLKEEKALILYGSGANGKSVFFEVVSALIGSDNVSNFSLQNLTNDNGYHRAKIADKLVNYASEINGKLEAATFKQLVSGEPVEARLPYGDPFILKQYAKLIFNCNELPKDVEHTNAFFRRFLIIPFDVTIPENEQDKNLHTKIIEKELSGVFNWVLAGLNRLLHQQRFTKSKAVTNAVEQYKIQSDSVRLFLVESNYQKSTNKHELLKGLYNEYKVFCLEDGLKPVKKANFRKRLEAIGVIIERKNIGNVVYLAKGEKVL